MITPVLINRIGWATCEHTPSAFKISNLALTISADIIFTVLLALFVPM